MIEDELARRESVEKAIRKAEFRATCLTWQELSDLIADRRSLIDALEKEQAHVKTLQIILDQECEHKNTAWAERDSAHALLREVLMVLPAYEVTLYQPEQTLRARIENELAQ